MPRFSRPLLAFALFAFASLVRADSLRLLAPADGATLRGGSFAELRWSAAQLPASAEEWEGFLSVDGGKYYAFRVTPHLDIDLQRFTFIVPNVDTRAARILIRTGDEVHETHFETRATFSIVRDPGADELLPRRMQLGQGEAARDGDPAVVSWTDGARNGSGVTQKFSATVPSSSLRRLATVTHDEAAVLEPPASCVAAPGAATTLQTAYETHAFSKIELDLISIDLLLVCRRRNI